ncbi:MAG: L,D-transpeptidase family protein [Candidatus Kerfeldbacteria bacterium]|nr:L,D-transpeptidase family protein [Candidatus Kerfeldbacteria bacterium]
MVETKTRLHIGLKQAVPFVLSAATFAFAVSFDDTILPGVTVGSVPVGGLTRQQATATIEQATSQQPIELRLNDHYLTATPADLGVRYDARPLAAKAFSVGRGRWWWRVPMTFDWPAEERQPYFDALVRSLGVQPKPATVTVGADGAFALVPGAEGLVVDESAVMAKLKPALERATAVTVDVPLVLARPAVTEDDLRPLVAAAEGLVAEPLTLKLGDQTVIVERPDLANWLAFGVESPPRTVAALGRALPAGPAGQLDLNADAVSEFLRAQAAAVERDPVAQTILKSQHKTDVLQVGVPGKRLVIDQAVAQVRTHLLAGDRQPLELALTDVPFETQLAEPPAAPIGTGKVVGVDLTKQQAYAYQDGQLVYSMKISSGINDWTPTGTFRVYAKTKKQKMSGPGYYLPNVPNILWFKGDYSLHGVYWHNDFGIRPRSHGCVGQSVDDSEWIFTWGEVGMPIVIYKN